MNTILVVLGAIAFVVLGALIAAGIVVAAILDARWGTNLLGQKDSRGRAK